MNRDQIIEPNEFANSDSISAPQVSLNGRYISYLLRTSGTTYIVRVDLEDGAEQTTYEVPVRFSHPLGGGSLQLCESGEEAYFITISGGIAKLDFAARKVTTIYHGPGVLQISLGFHETKIAAVIFGDRVALFDLAGGPAQTLSERVRVIKPFIGLQSRVESYVRERPDFIFDVNLSNNSAQVAWHEWALPNMPWEASQIALLDFSSADNEILICAGGNYYVSQPRFSHDGSKLGFLAECDSYLNLSIGDIFSWTSSTVVDEPFEHGGPPWGLGNRSFSFSPKGERVFYCRNEGGFGRLLAYDLIGKRLSELGKAHHFALATSNDSVVSIRSGAKTPNAIVTYQTQSGKRTEVAGSYGERFYRLDLPEPESYLASYSEDLYSYISDEMRDEFSSFGGFDIPYRIYSPAGHRGTELPTIMSFHGGPTDQPLVTYSNRNIAFLQQGYQVVQFDYRGSTGWGKPLRDALGGGFGVVEVIDLLTVLADMRSRALIGDQPIVLNGGSSGGYSALRALCATSNLFAGAIAEYPLIDLAKSVVSTHRFESRYFDQLIGVLPDHLESYQRRSIDAKQIDEVPLLIMHGDADPVVHYKQVVDFVENLQQLGKDVEFFLFEGQGHGFSDPMVIEKQYRAYHDFLDGIKSRVK